MCWSFVLTFYYFAASLTRSRIGAILGLVLAIGSGGAGGINLLFRDGWARALEGPLRAFAATSQLGRAFDVGDLTILPVNTAFYQHWVMSAGRIGPAHAGEVADAIALGRARGRVVLLAQHHPVTTHRNPVVHWVDGLRDHAKARSLLRDEPHVHVMHGHTHRRRDRSLDAARAAQVFSACAVVDGDAPLRVYACVDGVLRGADIAGDLGALRR